MTKDALTQFILDCFDVEGERIFKQYPDFLVFRRKRKWFALYMPVTGDKISANDDKIYEIVNVKIPAHWQDVLYQTSTAFYPAYHMNKKHWISVDIAQVDAQILQTLLIESFSLAT